MEDNKKPWSENAGNFLIVFSILAALAALLMGIVIQTKPPHHYSWGWPIFFLGFSFFCLFIAAEKITDALDEDDVRKYLFCLVFYNSGVMLLIYGITSLLYIKYKYPIGFVLFVIINVVISFPWIRHFLYLFFKPEDDFKKYIKEIENIKDSEELKQIKDSNLDWGFFIKLFYGCRKAANWFYSKEIPSKILKNSQQIYRYLHIKLDELLNLE